MPLLPPAEECQRLVSPHQLMGGCRIPGCGLTGEEAKRRRKWGVDSRGEVMRRRERGCNDGKDGEGYSAFSFVLLERKV